MRPEQEPIARWIENVLADKKWTAYRWAQETGNKVSATTIMRAVDPNRDGVTALRTVAALAAAADVPMPFGAGEAGDQSVFSEAVLSEIMPVVLATMGLQARDPEDLRLGVRLLRSVLIFLASDPDALDDLPSVRVAIRALATRVPLPAT